METAADKCSLTDFRTTVNLGAWLCHTLAITTNTILHFGCGERYAGIPGLLAVPIMLVYTTFMSRYDTAPMGAFIFLYCTLAVGHRLWAQYQLRRNRPIHSRFCGRPVLHLLVPRRNVMEVYRAESVLVCLIGFAVTRVNPPLGVFLIAAGVATAVSQAIAKAIARGQLLDRIDAMLEQQNQSEDVRTVLGQPGGLPHNFQTEIAH